MTTLSVAYVNTDRKEIEDLAKKLVAKWREQDMINAQKQKFKEKKPFLSKHFSRE